MELQKERENVLKIRICFQTGNEIVNNVSTRGHGDCLLNTQQWLRDLVHVVYVIFYHMTLVLATLYT